MMDNKIILENDGIYHYSFPKEITKEIAYQYIQELKNLTDRVPVFKQIIDVSLTQSVPNEEAKDALISGMKRLRPVHKKDRSAVIGVNTFLKIAARMILTIAGRSDVKIFDTTDEAIAWIKKSE